MQPEKYPATALLFLALIGSASAATYYVDAVNGNNSYTGTESQPWKTIAYSLSATSQVGPGDIVYLRGGTYREQVDVKKYGTSDNWITVKSYPGEIAVLDGTDPLTGWTQAQSNDPYLTVLGVVNPNYNNIYWTRIKASEFPSNLSNTVFFEDRVMCRIASDPDQSVGFGEETLEMRNVGEGSDGQASYLIDPTLNQEDDYWNGAIIRVFLYNYNANVVQKNVADYIKNERKIVFDSDMPANLLWDASSYHKDRYRFVNHPHILDSAGEFYVTGIENIEGTNYRRIYYWPKNTSNLTDKMAMASRNSAFSSIAKMDYYLIIEGLTVFGTKDTGIYFQGAGNGEQRGSHVIVRNCIITDCGGWGIYYVYMNYARAENNYVRRCNERGIMGNAVDHCVFKNNDVGDTGSTNISFYTATNSMIINNTVRGIRGGHGNGTSVYVDSEDILLAGNQYYNTNMALQKCRNLTVFANLFRGDASNPDYAITPWDSFDGHQVWINNTVPIAVTFALMLHQRNEWSIDSPRHYVVNNVFHGLLIGGDGPNYWDYDPSKISIEDRTYNIYTDYAWQQEGRYGWSLNQGEQDLRTTPLTDMFVNPTYPDGDYHPKENGPLYHTGKNVQGILTSLGIIAKFPEYDFSKDLAGNPWNSTPSIGAYEFQGTAPQQCAGTDSSCGNWPCQACGSLQKCCNNICTTPACLNDANCNDLNTATADTCNAANTCNANCIHTLIAECVDNTKLLDYISQWKQGSITLLALMQKMRQWKTGTGCH